MPDLTGARGYFTPIVYVAYVRALIPSCDDET